MPGAIRLHIDELVLEGFAPGDRYAIADAVQSELTRLLGEMPETPFLPEARFLPTIDAGAFDVAPNARPASIGAQIAHAVYGGLVK
jgi:hypothetical protein